MQADPDYLFAFPQLLLKRSFEGFGYHLGTAYIRAYLGLHGVVTEQFVHPGNATLDELAHLMAQHRPKIIGFTLYDVNYHIIRALACRLRRISPDTLVVCGGPTATFSDRIILENTDSVDVCVRFYGEVAAMELLQWVNGERTIESIPGISYRGKNGIVRTRDRTLREAFSPYFDVLRNESANTPSHESSLDIFPDPYLAGVLPPGIAHQVGLVTSRGCTFPCTYCNFAAMSRRTISHHSEDRIIAVLRFLDESLKVRQGAKARIPINDDNFSLNGARFHSLLKRIILEGFRNLTFWADMRAESLTDESFELLRTAGVTSVNFGLESAVPEVLARIKKVRSNGHKTDGYEKERIFIKRIAWAVDMAKRAGLRTSVSVILGLPGESEEQGRATLDFVDRLGVDEYAHNVLQVHEGTELMNHCREFGIRVTRSPGTILPLQTIHSYDVLQNPIFTNSVDDSFTTGIVMPIAMRLLTGTLVSQAEVTRDSGSGHDARSGQSTESGAHASIAPIVGLSLGAVTTSLCYWLEKEMPLSAHLWLLNETQESPETYRKQLAVNGMPVGEINSLRLRYTEQGARSWRVNELSLTAPHENTRTIHEIPFAAADSLRLSGIAHQKRSTVLLSIRTGEDMDALLKLVESGEEAGVWRLPSAYLHAEVSLADGCRWSGKVCPAVRGIRWFVDDEEYVYPCLNGGPLGKVGDSVADLKSVAGSFMAEQAIARGCGDCCAESFCSKCLFPSPVATHEFCRIRRQYIGLPVVVDGFSCIPMLRPADLSTNDENEFLICSLRSIKVFEYPWWRASTPLTEFLLFRPASSDTGALCHAGRNFLVQLSDLQTDLIETGVQKAAPGRVVDL